MSAWSGNWSEPLGWALIMAGLALATWTLREGARSMQAPVRLRAVHSPKRRISGATEWQRVTDVLQSGFARAETLADLHDRAIAEVEAADAAVGRLLAECQAALLSSGVEVRAPARAQHAPPAQQHEPTRLAA
jgi:hypothetical protein